MRRIVVGWTAREKGLGFAESEDVGRGAESRRRKLIDLPQALKWFMKSARISQANFRENKRTLDTGAGIVLASSRVM